MKKIIITTILLLSAIWSFGQSVPGCGTFTSHATINLSGASNQTISDYVIDAAGGQYCIRLTNCTNIHITRCKIINASTATYSGGIDIHGGSHITIDTCYFENDAYGILVQSVTGGYIVNNYNYFKDCEQLNRTTKGGCSIQWNQVSGAGLRANYNKSYHTTNNVNIGDQFSFYKVNGLPTDYMQHYYNECEGGSTESSGLAGTVLGDLGGSYQDGEFNTYVNAGMEGCQIQGGHDIIMSNNRIYGYKLTNSTVGLAFGNYTNPYVASYNITMANNKINFTNAKGQISSIWFDPRTAFAPTGWSSNTPAGQADQSIQASMLPVPLFGTCSTPVSPPSISYSPSSYIFTTGTSISSITPTNTGGAATSWSISPSIATGLNFSTSTGVITGTPTTVTNTSYVVTAMNAGGSNTAPISIQTKVPVVNKPVISYSPNTITATKGTAITPLTPANTGDAATSWSINAALPSGLVFNTSNGQISGTPTVLSASTGYTVSATNSGGTGTTGITVTVNDIKPNIGYSGTPYTFTQGSTIVPKTPTNSGGTPTSFAISPSLPAGLSFSTTTGVISGTPTGTQSATGYNITASNSGGNSVAPINITINAPAIVAPNISYSPNTQVGIINVAITNMNPVNVGGAAVSYSISPSLPSGLNFNTANGVISGVPTVTSSTTGYTVTANNTGGSSPTTVTLTINQVTAPNITYPYTNVVYNQGNGITPINPTNTGGTVSSYAITLGTLPMGLTLNTSTGQISGIPTVLQNPSTVRVTATNGGGTSNFNISMAVNPAPLNHWYLIDGKYFGPINY